MATTIQEVATFLNNQEVAYDQDADNNIIVTAFNVETYLDEDGNNKIGVLIMLEENGEFIRIFAPRCYICPDEANRAAVMQTLLMISWKTRMVQFELDDSDGEIRAMVEFPLEDAPLTERQLMRSIYGLLQTVDTYHPVIDLALTQGVIQFPDESQDHLAALQSMMTAFQGLLEEMGIDMDDVEALLENANAESDVPDEDADDADGDDFDDDDYI